MLPPIPAPPDILSAPVLVFVDDIFDEIASEPPAYKFPPIPTPPATRSAPVDVSVAGLDVVILVSFNVVVPPTEIEFAKDSADAFT